MDELPKKDPVRTRLVEHCAVLYRRYGLAIVAGLLALAATLSTSLLQTRPYIASFVAVIVSAWFGGVPPALVCTGLSLMIVAAARAFLSGVEWSAFDTVSAIAFATIAAIGAVIASFARSRTESEREAKRQGARLEAMFGQAAVGIALTDREGRITRANPRLTEKLGGTHHDTLALACADLTHADDRRRTEQAVQDVVAGKTSEFSTDSRYRRPDGSIVWLHVSISPLRDEDRRIDGLILIVEDITARRQAEDALRLADRQKDDFLALLSHELRNPLAPIRTAVQLLKMRGGADNDSRRLYDVIDRQVQQLVRLVDDLLDVSRMLRDKVDLSPDTIDLSGVMTMAVETVRPLVDAQRQDLRVEFPATTVHVRGDQIRLAQVLGNLLNNASKYTPRGGRISLSASLEGADAVIRVMDTGTGIPAEILPTIFEPFVQADRSLQRAQGGLGIGLTLVKKIVDLHGGTVTAASAGADLGSEFIVRLPGVRVAPFDAAPPSPKTFSVGDSHLRILVVDDNADAADSLEMLLVSMGHEVAISRDGVDAVQRTIAWMPDVVLLDIGLPGMSGYDVASELRREFATPPSLIALTGYGQASDRQRAMVAGFDEHLVKPIDVATLEATLAHSVLAKQHHGMSGTA